MNSEIIHCVRHAEDPVALCGIGDMAPAMDLFTGVWQAWRLKYPDQQACANCDQLWRPLAMEMQREKFKLNNEFNIV